jgi:hypothetical protein
MHPPLDELLLKPTKPMIKTKSVSFLEQKFVKPQQIKVPQEYVKQIKNSYSNK